MNIKLHAVYALITTSYAFRPYDVQVTATTTISIKDQE